MKQLLLAILLTLSTQAKDFLEKDKIYHVGASTAISYTISNIALYNNVDKFSAFWIGFGSTLAIGVAKEFLDSKSKKHTEDINDVYADLIGATSGALFAISFSWKF